MQLPKRKRQIQKPTPLPKEFLHSVSKLFAKQFQAELAGSTFLVYGDIYPNEAVLCVSLAHPKSLRAASLHLSADVPPSVASEPEKVTEQLKEMVDVAASWFAQGFQKGKGLEPVLKEIEDADANWQEIQWEGKPLFVKLNRANYTLEKAANDFLEKAGFETDEDEFDEDGNEPRH